MGFIKNSVQFAELEYGFRSYFNSYVAPMMQQVEDKLNSHKKEEIADFQSSMKGIFTSTDPFGLPINNLDGFKVTAEWNAKTTEDYIEMCKSSFLAHPTLTKDMVVLSNHWRNTVIDEIGKDKYDSLSAKLGTDLAYAYVDYRMQQLMIDKLVANKIPRSSLDYILQKASKLSIYGMLNEMNRSALDIDIDNKADRAYAPSLFEQAAGSVLGTTADVATSGGLSTWSTFAKFAGVDLAVNQLATKNVEEVKLDNTVEKCISIGVFGAKENVFQKIRAQSETVDKENSPLLNTLNKELDCKILFPSFKIESFMPFQTAKKSDFLPSKTRSEKYKDVPLVVTPGQEEEYLASLKSEKVEESHSEKDTIALQETAVHHSERLPQDDNLYPEQHNMGGWAGVLSSFGLDGITDVTKNLGYVVSMLPDLFVGLFTGKSKSLLPMNNLLPLASIVGGLFVKNPILKTLLIGLGGINLINKVGKEAIEQHNHPEVREKENNTARYKVYKDEQLNGRIQNPLLQGNCLIATIDKVPCSISLSNKVIDAYNKGVLPLNTLANAVLARNDQMRQIAQEQYNHANEETATRSRGIL